MHVLRESIKGAVTYAALSLCESKPDVLSPSVYAGENITVRERRSDTVRWTLIAARIQFELLSK